MGPYEADPYFATEVKLAAQIAGQAVLITRSGGLFIRPPEHLKAPEGAAPDEATIREKLKFEEEAADLFNRLICELCCLGRTCEPASPVQIAAGQLIDNHAAITGAGGGRDPYYERTAGPFMALLGPYPAWMAWLPIPEQLIIEAAKLTRAQSLYKIAPSLPTFVAGAYSHFSRRHLSAALSDAFVVVEQLVDHRWQQHMQGLTGSQLKQLKKDGRRSLNIGYRIDALKAVGALDESLYDVINHARCLRNQMLHGARITYESADAAISAMKETVESTCQTSIRKPECSNSVNW